jgi:hypothetical protein
VLKEVDEWLRDRPMEMASPCVWVSAWGNNFFLQSIPLRIAREAVGKCRAVVRGKERDKKNKSKILEE